MIGISSVEWSISWFSYSRVDVDYDRLGEFGGFRKNGLFLNSNSLINIPLGHSIGFDTRSKSLAATLILKEEWSQGTPFRGLGINLIQKADGNLSVSFK